MLVKIEKLRDQNWKLLLVLQSVRKYKNQIKKNKIFVKNLVNFKLSIYI